MSLFHDRVGLIVGGGNTKLQPLWSTFTVGDTALLFHREGNEAPDFTPPKGLFHVPIRATLEADNLALSLVYGDTVSVSCRVAATFDNDNTARLLYSITSLPLPRADRCPRPVTAAPRRRVKNGDGQEWDARFHIAQSHSR